MRLIDADELLERVEASMKNNTHRNGNAALNHISEHMRFMRLIVDQPTLFDVEGKKLMEIYKLFNIDGSLKRKLTVKEMVMLYHIADVMRGGTMHKLIEKVEAYKEKVIGKEIEKNELKYKEAADNYNDTGYDRYYNKMQKLDKELDELKNYIKKRRKVRTRDRYNDS